LQLEDAHRDSEPYGASKFELVGWNMQCSGALKQRIVVNKNPGNSPSKCHDAVLKDARCGAKTFFEVGNSWCGCYTGSCTNPGYERHEDLYKIKAKGAGASPTKACDETYAGEKGAAYTGCQTQTRSGKTCQQWASQSPHKHSYPRVGEHNYCRNPSKSDGIWCYTTASKTRWEYCNPKAADVKNPHSKYELVGWNMQCSGSMK
jgi:hypothetical protein